MRQSGDAAGTYLVFSEMTKLLGPNSRSVRAPEGKLVITSVLAIGMPDPRKSELTHKFVDYMATPETPEVWCLKIVCRPPNPRTHPTAELRPYRPAADLLWAPDWDLINRNRPAWDDRFSKVVPTRSPGMVDPVRQPDLSGRRQAVNETTQDGLHMRCGR